MYDITKERQTLYLTNNGKVKFDLSAVIKCWKNSVFNIQNKTWIIWNCTKKPWYNSKLPKTKYSGSLAFCGFQWCSFHSRTFSNHSPNIQLMGVSLLKWRNSSCVFEYYWLKCCGFGSCRFLSDLKNAQAKDWVYGIY